MDPPSQPTQPEDTGTQPQEPETPATPSDTTTDTTTTTESTEHVFNPDPGTTDEGTYSNPVKVTTTQAEAILTDERVTAAAVDEKSGTVVVQLQDGRTVVLKVGDADAEGTLSSLRAGLGRGSAIGVGTGARATSWLRITDAEGVIHHIPIASPTTQEQDIAAYAEAVSAGNTIEFEDGGKTYAIPWAVGQETREEAIERFAQLPVIAGSGIDAGGQLVTYSSSAVGRGAFLWDGEGDRIDAIRDHVEKAKAISRLSAKEQALVDRLETEADAEQHFSERAKTVKGEPKRPPAPSSKLTPEEEAIGHQPYEESQDLRGVAERETQEELDAEQRAIQARNEALLAYVPEFWRRNYSDSELLETPSIGADGKPSMGYTFDFNLNKGGPEHFSTSVGRADVFRQLYNLELGNVSEKAYLVNRFIQAHGTELEPAEYAEYQRRVEDYDKAVDRASRRLLLDPNKDPREALQEHAAKVQGGVDTADLDGHLAAWQQEQAEGIRARTIYNRAIGDRGFRGTGRGAGGTGARNLRGRGPVAADTALRSL